MDFDAVTTSPEFASIMANPQALIESLEQGLSGSDKQQPASQALAKTTPHPGERAIKAVMLGSSPLARTPAQPASSPKDLPLPVSSSSSPLSDQLFEDETPSQDTAAEPETATPQAFTAKPFDLESELLSAKKQQEKFQSKSIKSQPETQALKKEHHRLSSSSSIPLRLPGVLKQRVVSPIPKEEASHATVSSLLPEEEKPAPIGSLHKPQTSASKGKDSTSALLSWADEVIKHPEISHQPPHGSMPGGFHDDSSSTEGSFISVRSVQEESDPAPIPEFTSYSDIAKAYSSLSNQLQRIESRLILHERECASEMAVISHRSGGNWSKSSHQNVTKAISSPPTNTHASLGSLASQQTQSVKPSPAEARPLVSSLVATARREHPQLPPRVASARAKQLMKELQLCADTASYTTLPVQLDQMLEVLKEETLSLSLSRMS